LAAERTHDLVQALVEVLTIALQHPLNRSRLTFYVENGSVITHIQIPGPVTMDPLIGYAPPSGLSDNAITHLWSVRQLVDIAEIVSHTSGTDFRLIQLSEDWIPARREGSVSG